SRGSCGNWTSIRTSTPHWPPPECPPPSTTSTSRRWTSCSRRAPSAHCPKTRDRDETGRSLPVRPGRADLPDVGAHLRLQSGVHALPVVFRTTLPALNVHG